MYEHKLPFFKLFLQHADMTMLVDELVQAIKGSDDQKACTSSLMNDDTLQMVLDRNQHDWFS